MTHNRLVRFARRAASPLAAALALAAAPAMADEAAPAEGAVKPFTISGSAAVVSDYRLRGVSQSNKHIAIQAGATVTHKSGAYAGVWGSNLAGWGTFGGSNTEFDLIGGFARPIGSVTVDVGLTWYMYPGGAAKTDFAEPFVKLSTVVGPAKALVGVAYAPKQQALGNWSNTPQSREGSGYDNLYLWGDGSVGIPKTPITAKAHLGYSRGNPGLGPNGTSVAPTGSYWDWMIGADLALGKLTLGIAYVDTDISKAKAAYLQPNFSSTKDGSSISGSTVVFSGTVAF
ncbi:MAG TPA: TorF family putative porin [Novosphingobium sp.]|nr:TorF family putative porin [Novosphingobium sp.]